MSFDEKKEDNSPLKELDEVDLNLIEKTTNLDRQIILDYYKKFTQRYASGYISREQFNEILKKLIFVNEDVNNNNKSVPNETEQTESKREREKSEICERLFNLCDRDYNGFIDFKEYLILFWFKLSFGSHEDKLSLLFDMLDMNNNGYIDFHELHSTVKTLFKLKYSDGDETEEKTKPKEREETLAPRVQYNKELNDFQIVIDSQLPDSYHIAMSIMRKFDVNHNGKLTKKEFIDGCLQYDKIREFLSPLKVL
jgi:Ca2+-binding EF-hand superfamily protein